MRKKQQQNHNSLLEMTIEADDQINEVIASLNRTIKA